MARRSSALRAHVGVAENEFETAPAAELSRGRSPRRETPEPGPDPHAGGRKACPGKAGLEDFGLGFDF